MAGIKPPEDVSPAELFLTLAEWPAPKSSLSFRFPSEPDAPLAARAISAADWHRALRGNGPSSIIAASLVDHAGRRVFSDAQDVGRCLEQSEMLALFSEITMALDRISPHFGRVDMVRWAAVLTQGATECPSVANSMGGCFDIALGFNQSVKKGRPDRYFGAPMRELLDGHHMVFKVAFDLVTR